MLPSSTGHADDILDDREEQIQYVWVEAPDVVTRTERVRRGGMDATRRRSSTVRLMLLECM
jgi:hypothetical protein